MWFLYVTTFIAFIGPLLYTLIYAALMYLIIALPLRILSQFFEDRSARFIYDKKGIQRYRGWGWMVGIYARNIALSIADQGIATVLGQAPDISISEALGLAKLMHELGLAEASKFILWFGRFVDLLFWNSLYKIEKDHISQSLDIGENFYNTLKPWHDPKKPGAVEAALVHLQLKHAEQEMAA